MKIKQGYTLREIGGEQVVFPEQDELDMMIRLNDTGAALWKALEQETDLEALTAMLIAQYGIDENRARSAAEGFVQKLQQNNLLETV